MKRNNPQVIDLSWTICEDMPIYPGDPALKISGGRTDQADGFSLKTLLSAMHVGTHLDAPSHFLGSGGDILSIPLEDTLGLATKLRITPTGQVIRTEDLAKMYELSPQKHRMIVIDSGYAHHKNRPDYFTEYPSFEASLTDFMKEKSISLIGLDMPSIRYSDGGGARAHQELLGEKIVIVENLTNLELVDDEFLLIALPLKLAGFDGSMIRAVAINRWKTFY
jgi:arylformamidase